MFFFVDFSDFVAILPWIVAVFRGVAVLVIGPGFANGRNLIERYLRAQMELDNKLGL